MVFMILMDFFMILNSTLVEPVAYGLKHFCNVTFLTYGIEQFYLTFFQMTSAEMSGIRHMRTITQLTFETVLQFGVQISMLLHYMTDGSGVEEG